MKSIIYFYGQSNRSKKRGRFAGYRSWVGGIEMYELKFPGRLLDKGFWIYVWEITPPRGKKKLYVGMTGDAASRVAQSPFNRASTHLGHNRVNNTLRKKLEAAGVSPESCCRFRLLAHRVCNSRYTMAKRNNVATIEMKLYESLKANYEVLNDVHCKRRLDKKAENTWGNVHRAFKRHFPKMTTLRVKKQKGR